MKRTLLALLIAIVLGLPLGWITAMLLTPLLWRLEPILHMELAGHSGPSDWIFILIWLAMSSALFLLWRVLVDTPHNGGAGRPPATHD